MAASTTTVVRTPDGARIKFRRLLLVVERGPDAGLERDLDGGTLVLGRGEDVDLCLADETVSREHCRLTVDAERVQVQDLESRSGTRVNGVAVGAASLDPGARLELGETVIKLVAVETELSVPRHGKDEFEGLLGASPPMRELFGLIDKVAPLHLPVLLRGETGAGKEGLAKALHVRGERRAGPFVAVDCTLLSDPTHARSELFGHTPGAFTGAEGTRRGAFSRADGGTLFLDEIGDLPEPLQVQLLRVLQEGEVRPLGAESATKVSVRLVSATHHDLEELVAAGRFRADLFYRLAGIVLEVPPLRARGDDVLRLARSFLPAGLALDAEAERALLGHPWPGNVRELRFVLERAAALARDQVVRVEDLALREPSSPRPRAASGARPPGQPVAVPLSSRERVAQLDRDSIVAALERTAGNRKEAARLLGVSRATLYRKLAQFGLEH